MKHFVFAFSAIAILSGSTLAADLVASEPAIVTAASSDWTGFYAGVHAGYGVGQTTDSLDCGFPYGSVSWAAGQGAWCDGVDEPIALTALQNDDGAPWYTSDDLSEMGGWLAGAQAGYRHQIGNFVLGGEVSGSVTSISDTGVTAIDMDIDGDGIYSGSIAANWLVLGTASIGYAIGENLLVSAVGGVALGGLEFQSSAGYSDENVAQGYTVGVQGDVKLSDNVSAFAAYNYVYFGDVKYEGNSAGDLIANFHEYNTELHLLKAGINYSFN